MHLMAEICVVVRERRISSLFGGARARGGVWFMDWKVWVTRVHYLERAPRVP